jgi:dihydroflavonol-4-reductase
MSVFITGANGFIGSNLVEALNESGIEPVILRRESSSLKLLKDLRYKSVIGDILDSPSSLAASMEGAQIVFHAAALSDYRWQDEKLIYEINVGGTANVLAAAKAAGVSRFVFTSSLSALGIPEEGEVMDESHEFNLSPKQFPYGHSKYLAEIEVRKAVDGGLDAFIVNPSGVVGPRGAGQTVFALFREAASGRLRFYPPGGLNIVAVQDVAAALLAVVDHGRVGENYIIAGENVSYKDAITVGCEVVGTKPPIARVPGWILPPLASLLDFSHGILGDRIPLEANQVRLAARHVYADGSKSIHELGLAYMPFRAAVESAFHWYLENGYL